VALPVLLSPDIMRLFLLLCLLSLAILAVFYLRERSLSLPAYLSWALLIVMLPLLGPFIVILMKPGHRRN